MVHAVLKYPSHSEPGFLNFFLNFKIFFFWGSFLATFHFLHKIQPYFYKLGFYISSLFWKLFALSLLLVFLN